MGLIFVALLYYWFLYITRVKLAWKCYSSFPKWCIIKQNAKSIRKFLLKKPLKTRFQSSCWKWRKSSRRDLDENWIKFNMSNSVKANKAKQHTTSISFVHQPLLFLHVGVALYNRHFLPYAHSTLPSIHLLSSRVLTTKRFNFITITAKLLLALR